MIWGCPRKKGRDPRERHKEGSYQQPHVRCLEQYTRCNKATRKPFTGAEELEVETAAKFSWGCELAVRSYVLSEIFFQLPPYVHRLPTE